MVALDGVDGRSRLPRRLDDGLPVGGVVAGAVTHLDRHRDRVDSGGDAGAPVEVADGREGAHCVEADVAGIRRGQEGDAAAETVAEEADPVVARRRPPEGVAGVGAFAAALVPRAVVEAEAVDAPLAERIADGAEAAVAARPPCRGCGGQATTTASPPAESSVARTSRPPGTRTVTPSATANGAK